MNKIFTGSYGKGISLPILIKFTTSEKGFYGLLNVDFEDGLFKRRRGWKTFKSMVRELDRLNKQYKKMKVVGDFTVRLPIRGSK